MKELQHLDAQIRIASERLDQFVAQEKKLQDALLLLTELHPNQTIRVPLVDGIFVEATVSHMDSFFVHTGMDVVVSQKKDEVIALLSEQLIQTQRYRDELTKKLMEYSERADELGVLEKQEHYKNGGQDNV